jgi:hypothetical protein
MQRELETLTPVHPMPAILWVGTLSGLTHQDPANRGPSVFLHGPWV